MANHLRPILADHIHIHLFHRHRCVICWRYPLRHSRMGPHGSDIALVISFMSLLRGIFLCPRSPWCQHLCKLAFCSQRSHRAISAICKYTSWAAPLCSHRVGSCSMENSQERRHLPKLYVCVRGISGTYCGNHGLRLLLGPQEEVRYAGALSAWRDIPLLARYQLARGYGVPSWCCAEYAGIHPFYQHFY